MMKDSLSIRLFSGTRLKRLWGNSNAFILESDNLDHYSSTERPHFVEGYLLGANLGELLRFKSGETIDISFRGTHYKFEEVKLDGSVKLRKLDPSEVGRT